MNNPLELLTNVQYVYLVLIEMAIYCKKVKKNILERSRIEQLLKQFSNILPAFNLLGNCEVCEVVG